MEDKSVIEVQNLKAYYVLKSVGKSTVTEIKAVDGVSLYVGRNEILGIAGESGCGKSTLIKAMYGLITPPLTVIEGSIIYNSLFEDNETVDLVKFNKNELNRVWWKYVSYIPQSSMNVLNPVRRIKDQFLDIVKSSYGDIGERDALNMLVEHIDRMGLPREVITSFPHQLSGGMKQRVVIALATIFKPRVIFADEPTTALDVVIQRGIIQLLSRIQRELNNTLVVVTHDMGVHAQIASRLAIMYAGKVIELGAAYDIFGNPLHPYTKYLISSLPKIGDKSRKVSIPGKPPSLRNPPSGCRFHPRCPYAMDECRLTEPSMMEVEHGHYVACHLYWRR